MKKPSFTKYMTSISLCLGLFLYPYPVFPVETGLQSEPELSWVIKNIKEKEKTLKTFTAKFIQIKKSYLLQEPLHSEGSIYFNHIGKMLIKTTSPSPSKVLLKNNLLFIHYPGLLKAEERYLGNEEILEEYFGIGQPIERLQERYSIYLVSKTLSGSYYLKLMPKIKAIARYIDMIEVMVSPKNWFPERIHFKEVKGDYTSIQLEFTSINEPLPPGIFKIDLPEDHEDDL